MDKYTHTPGVSTGKQETSNERWQRRISKGLISSGERFVNPYLSPADEEAVQKYLDSGELPNPWSVVSRLLEQGLGVSFRRHQDSQYCCTLTDGSRQDADKRYMLSGWGPDVRSALAVALYKHEQLLNSDWDNAENLKRPARTLR